jgi:hypothetical protein
MPSYRPTPLPPLDSLPEAVRKLASEFTDLVSRAQKAENTLFELKRARPNALALDAAAGAAALRGHRSDPGPVNAAKNAADIGTAEHRAAALTHARDLAEAELKTALTDALPAWKVALEADLSDARAECRQVIQALDAARKRMQSIADLLDYCARWPNPKVYSPRSAPVVSLRSLNGQSLGWDDVAEALTADAADPTPAAPAHRYESRIVEDRTESGVLLSQTHTSVRVDNDTETTDVDKTDEARGALFVPSDPDAAPLVVPPGRRDRPPPVGAITNPPGPMDRG